jgi:hypothetical protein
MLDDHISVRRHGRREIITYDVTPDQLDRLEKAGTELGFNFHIALTLLTLAISFLTGLILSPPTNETTKTVFVSITVAGFILGIIFGIKWYGDRDAHSAIFREIRAQPEIGPLGDETHEVKRTDLNRLILEAAPAPTPAPAPAQVDEAAPAPAATAMVAPRPLKSEE